MEEVKFVFSMDDKFSAAAKKAEGSVGGLESKLGGIKNLVSGAFSIAAVVGFEKAAIGAYMKMEGYEARMTTLLHSREAALMAIDNIVVDAAKTPFDLESLIQGNSMLIGAGASASNARQSIMDLGNAIAATGGGSDELNRMAVNLSQIKSIGKASALDVKQFMYANIPIYELLSKSMHKNVREIKEMDISYKDLTKALADARAEGGMFYHGLENANKTLSGSVSNLGDSWDQLMTTIGKSQSGILKGTVQWANDMLTELNMSQQKANDLYKSLNRGGYQETNIFGGKITDYGAETGKHKYYGGLNESIQGGMKKAGESGIGAEANIAREQIKLTTAIQDLIKDKEKGIIAPNDFLAKYGILKTAKELGDTLVGQIRSDREKEKESKANELAAKKKDKEASKVKSQTYTQIHIRIDQMTGVETLVTNDNKSIPRDIGLEIVKLTTKAVEDSQIVANI